MLISVLAVTAFARRESRPLREMAKAATDFGHGVGVEIHEAPNASPMNEKPLPAGAVISAEPGIYLPGRLGVRIEDVILLTETGCRNITKAPKDLIVL